MANRIALLLFLHSLGFTAPLISETIPGTIAIGAFTTSAPVESAVAVRSSKDDVVCVYASAGQLQAQRGTTSEGSLKPVAIDISGRGIAAVRDVKAFHRFDNLWMVFFVAIDDAGNESIRALEFDANDVLVYSPYGIFDDPSLGSKVAEYHVLNDAILSFYVVARMDGCISIAFAGHDPDLRNLLFDRHSINLLDNVPLGMLCRKSGDRIEIAADYASLTAKPVHTVVASFKDGRINARCDLGGFHDKLIDFTPYMLGPGLDRAAFLRSSELSVRPYMNGQYGNGATFSPSGRTLLQAGLSDLSGTTFFVSAYTCDGVELFQYSTASGQAGLITSLPGSSAARAFYAQTADSFDYYLISNDALKLRAIEHLSFETNDGKWSLKDPLLVRDHDAAQKSALCQGIVSSPERGNLGYLEFDPAKSEILLYSIGPTAVSGERTGKLGNPILAGTSGGVFYPLLSDSSYIASDGNRILSLDKDGIARMLPAIDGAGSGSDRRVLISRTGDSISVNIIME